MKEKIWKTVGHIFFSFGMLGFILGWYNIESAEYISHQTYYVLESISGLLLAILGIIMFKK